MANRSSGTQAHDEFLRAAGSTGEMGPPEEASGVGGSHSTGHSGWMEGGDSGGWALGLIVCLQPSRLGAPAAAGGTFMGQGRRLCLAAPQRGTQGQERWLPRRRGGILGGDSRKKQRDMS